jgi:nucleoside-diphosphate-sugar epimerase
MPSPASVLVTGAAGFMGARVVEALRTAGHAVVAAGRTPGPGIDAAADLCAPGAAEELLRHAGPGAVVVHLAALAHGKAAGPGFDAVNHRATRALLRAAREAGAARFVFASSASVYGHAGREGPLREDDERRPIGAYARSKRDAEDACFEADAAGLPCAVLRFPAVYARDWLLDVRKRAYVPGTGGRVLLRVAGRQPAYSLCAVENAVQALRMAAEGTLGHGAWNVADAAPYAQREVSRVIGALDGRRLAAPVLPAAVGMAVAAAGALLGREKAAVLDDHRWKLMRGLVLDLGKIQAAGFRPRARLEDLLAAESDRASRSE